MSKIELTDEIIQDGSSKNKKKSKHHKKAFRKWFITFFLLSLFFGFVIVKLIVETVDIPFSRKQKEVEKTVVDSIDVSLQKINFVKRSFLHILENSFWDHENFTDINYSNKNIELAVNNLFGYQDKNQKWEYIDNSEGEFVTVEGTKILNNVKFITLIKFSISEDMVYFHDIQLKEYRYRTRGKFIPATNKQRVHLIQTMYRN